MFKTKKHRLQKEYYEAQTIAFTLCFEIGKTGLSKKIFKPLNEILINELKNNGCLLHIWLLMPDHCHMVIEAGQNTKNILHTIDKFKQYSGYWFYKNKLKIKWKKSYYDHILRSEKDVENQIYYVLNNPVRKGLVESWKEYPYRYSMIYDLNEL